jgi:hypothetical protein
MAFLKILLIGSALLISTIASADGSRKTTDDLLLEDLNSPSSMQVSMKAVNHESASAAQAMLGRKYKKFQIAAEQIQPKDGMVVALQPARR